MKYECQKCGACCRPQWIEGSAYAAAIARPADRPRICEHLGMTDEELCEKYGIIPDTGHMPLTKDGCRFQNDDGTCSIHEIKPSLCTAFPWNTIGINPEHTIAFAQRCPGITLEIEDLKLVYKWILELQSEIRKLAGVMTSPMA